MEALSTSISPLCHFFSAWPAISYPFRGALICCRFGSGAPTWTMRWERALNRLTYRFNWHTRSSQGDLPQLQRCRQLAPLERTTSRLQRWQVEHVNLLVAHARLI